jgi:hypothetical protein
LGNFFVSSFVIMPPVVVRQATSKSEERSKPMSHERSMSHEQAKAKSAANAKELFIWRWRVACAAHGVWFLTFMFWFYRYRSYRYR